MKTKLFVVIIILFSIAPLSAQQSKGITGETNWFNNWTNFTPATTIYKEANQIITGTIDRD